eukprot:SAG25_NODE_660_length_6096_cov_2.291764_1_plen_82_part_00
MCAKSRDSADSLDSIWLTDLSDEVKLRWIQFISVKLTVALGLSFESHVGMSVCHQQLRLPGCMMADAWLGLPAAALRSARP